MMRIADWKTQKTVIAHRVIRRVHRFRGEEDGALIVFAMFLIIGMLVAAGLGVDLMLYEAQRTRLQATLDRAILAAAHPDQKTDRKDVVESYFTSAGLGKYIKREDIKVSANSVSSEVSAKATMHVDPLLLQFVGMNGFDAVASGTASQAAKYIEVSLVVDVSGSMRDKSTTGKSKLYELKTSALKFSNQLLCNPEDTSTSTNCTYKEKNTSLSLVPYSSQVLVGKKFLSKFTRTDAQDDAYCATFTDADYDVAGIDADLPIRQTARYYGFGPSYLWDRIWRDPNGWNEPAGDDAEGADTYWSCFTAPWRKVQPLEDSPTQMRDRINGLDGLGGTAIHVGMKWGVALLDNDIQPAIDKMITDEEIRGGFLGRPFAPVIQESSKIVVLMTDGLNSNNFRLKDGYRTGPSPFWWNTSSTLDNEGVLSIYNPVTEKYHRRNVPSGYDVISDQPYGKGTREVCDWEWNDYRREWEWECHQVDEPGTPVRLSYEEFWRAGFTWRIFEDYSFLGEPGTYLANKTGMEHHGFQWDPDGNGIGNVDELLLRQCTAAKNANMTIYTIELETDGGSGGGSILKKCSSGDGYYFKVNGSGLDAAFSTIGQDIVKLRLTK